MINIQNLTFKNRISLYFIIYSSFILLFVFFLIYFVVQKAVNHHINSEITLELEKHYQEIEIQNNTILPLRKTYWQEREHISHTVNPVFVQIFDINNNTVDYSPNLFSQKLKIQASDNVFYAVKFNTEIIRQIQKPIIHQNKTIGYIVVAMALKDLEVVKILKIILLLSYPIIILLLFLVARFFSGKSIEPVNTIIQTSKNINQNHFSERIPLPKNKDELYDLSQNINFLLDRIESAIIREKQFTSDASHELRTPLAIMKGTLEVLIRKPRTIEEYQEKIKLSIIEIDKMNLLIDELLLLARFENQKQNIKQEKCYLNAIILDSLTQYSTKIKTKNITVNSVFENDFYIFSDQYLLNIIISNLISNALKYSKNNQSIEIKIFQDIQNTTIEIIDFGIGIEKDDLDNIFNPFYRTETTLHQEIKGNGLGLSIVKRLCELLSITIEIESKINLGTTVFLKIKH